MANEQSQPIDARQLTGAIMASTLDLRTPLPDFVKLKIDLFFPSVASIDKIEGSLRRLTAGDVFADFIAADHSPTAGMPFITENWDVTISPVIETRLILESSFTPLKLFKISGQPYTLCEGLQSRRPLWLGLYVWDLQVSPDLDLPKLKTTLAMRELSSITTAFPKACSKQDIDWQTAIIGLAESLR